MRKGFTLLELLATIVIIAVVLTIAIPITMNVIDYVRKESFKISVSNIGRAGEYTYSRSEIDNPLTKEVIFMYEDGNETSNIVGVTLDYDGEKPMHGNVVINKEGYVAISVHNGTYCATKEFTDKEVKVEEISVEDCIREMHLPQIFIVGDYEVDVEINTPYVDEFVTAVTSMGEEITEIEKAIIKDSTVVDSIDTTELGTYSIAYQVEEDDKTVTIFRTVNIVDTIAPVINHPGDTNILSSEVMTFNVLAGVTVADNSLESLSATVSGGFSKIPDSYIITYRAEDSSGNITTETRVINVNDASAPIITILGDNPMNININDSYTELGATATDEVDGDVTGLIEKSGSIDTTIKGTQYITYSVTDLSGNTSSLSRTVNIIDNIEPTIDFGIKLSDTFAKSHVVGVTATDDHSSINTLKYAWTTSTTEPGTFNNNFANGATITTPSGVSGSYYLWVEAVDSEGNRAVSRTDSYDLDNTPPVISHPGSESIVINEVNSYSLSNGVSVTDNSGETPVISVSGNLARIPGVYEITYSATDSSGNERVVTRNITVNDVEAPVITLLGSNPVNMLAGGTYNESGATATDDVDGNLTSSIVVTGSVNTSIVGSYTVTYTVTDSSGNTSNRTRTVNVTDNTPPSVSFSLNGSATYSKSRTTSVTVSDADSGVASRHYLWTSTTTTPSASSITSSFTNGASIATPSGVTGARYLWIKAVDNAGNQEIIRTNVFNLDNTIPVITRTGGNTSVALGGSYTDAGATASDNINGNITSRITTSGSVNTNIAGTYTITYNVTDLSGNVATSVTRTVTVNARTEYRYRDSYQSCSTCWNTCSESQAASSSTTYSCSSGSLSGTNCVWSEGVTSQIARELVCNHGVKGYTGNSQCWGNCNSSCGAGGTYSGAHVTSDNCPSLYGSSCTTDGAPAGACFTYWAATCSYSVPASSSTSYSCPSGWSRSGSTCSRSYSCNPYDCNCSTYWGSWSSWSTTSRTASSTRQVETRQITSI